MNWAVIKTGGKQYRVKPGQVLRVEKLPGEAGKPVQFSEVLLYVDGDKVEIGKPLVQGMSVEGKIKAQGRGEKLTIFKFKAKVRYRVKTGHRQSYTEVEITKIGPPSAKAMEGKAAAIKPVLAKETPTQKTSLRAARKVPPKRATPLRTRKSVK